MLQVIEQFVAGRITLVQIAGQGAVQNLIEAVIHAGVEGSEIRDG
jgi:hypothetical protein